MSKPDFLLSTKTPFLPKPFKANTITIHAESKNNFKVQAILRDGINTLDKELTHSINSHIFEYVQSYSLLDFIIKEGDEINIYISLT